MITRPKSGPLKTPLLMEFLNTPEKRNRRLVHIPTGRFGEAIEQARAALFLATDESSYITVSITFLAPIVHDLTMSEIQQGMDFKVDGGISGCYVTPEGDPALPPPASLAS
ncbi:hypothetical protein FRC12_023721 [Ceratobasidium sp. 428]|nr:hypothetical protein FRC12_023721 [Ceratobasidium sp. 428]